MVLGQIKTQELIGGASAANQFLGFDSQSGVASLCLGIKPILDFSEPTALKNPKLVS
jgi:hypothetical protein